MTPPQRQPDEPAISQVSFDTMVNRLLARGLKRTHALTCLLREMLADPLPRPLAEWAARPSLRERSEVTIYRLMLRLEETGVVRRVNLGGRTQSFQLPPPGPAPDYLVCTQCGDLKQVETPAEIDSLKALIEQTTGWKELRHELEYFGVCPSCTV